MSRNDSHAVTKPSSASLVSRFDLQLNDIRTLSATYDSVNQGAECSKSQEMEIAKKFFELASSLVQDNYHHFFDDKPDLGFTISGVDASVLICDSLLKLYKSLENKSLADNYVRNSREILLHIIQHSLHINHRMPTLIINYLIVNRIESNDIFDACIGFIKNHDESTLYFLKKSTLCIGFALCHVANVCTPEKFERWIKSASSINGYPLSMFEPSQDAHSIIHELILGNKIDHVSQLIQRYNQSIEDILDSSGRNVFQFCLANYASVDMQAIINWLYEQANLDKLMRHMDDAGNTVLHQIMSDFDKFSLVGWALNKKIDDISIYTGLTNLHGETPTSIIKRHIVEKEKHIYDDSNHDCRIVQLSACQVFLTRLDPDVQLDKQLMFHMEKVLGGDKKPSNRQFYLSGIMDVAGNAKKDWRLLNYKKIPFGWHCWFSGDNQLKEAVSSNHRVFAICLDDGRTVIDYAIERGDYKSVKSLLSLSKLNLEEHPTTVKQLTQLVTRYPRDKDMNSCIRIGAPFAELANLQKFLKHVIQNGRFDDANLLLTWLSDKQRLQLRQSESFTRELVGAAITRRSRLNSKSRAQPQHASIKLIRKLGGKLSREQSVSIILAKDLALFSMIEIDDVLIERILPDLSPDSFDALCDEFNERMAKFGSPQTTLLKTLPQFNRLDLLESCVKHFPAMKGSAETGTTLTDMPAALVEMGQSQKPSTHQSMSSSHVSKPIKSTKKKKKPKKSSRLISAVNYEISKKHKKESHASRPASTDMVSQSSLSDESKPNTLSAKALECDNGVPLLKQVFNFKNQQNSNQSNSNDAQDHREVEASLIHAAHESTRRHSAIQDEKLVKVVDKDVKKETTSKPMHATTTSMLSASDLDLQRPIDMDSQRNMLASSTVLASGYHAATTPIKKQEQQRIKARYVIPQVEKSDPKTGVATSLTATNVIPKPVIPSNQSPGLFKPTHVKSTTVSSTDQTSRATNKHSSDHIKVGGDIVEVSHEKWQEGLPPVLIDVRTFMYFETNISLNGEKIRIQVNQTPNDAPYFCFASQSHRSADISVSFHLLRNHTKHFAIIRITAGDIVELCMVPKSGELWVDPAKLQENQNDNGYAVNDEDQIDYGASSTTLQVPQVYNQPMQQQAAFAYQAVLPTQMQPACVQAVPAVTYQAPVLSQAIDQYGRPAYDQYGQPIMRDQQGYIYRSNTVAGNAYGLMAPVQQAYQANLNYGAEYGHRYP